MKGCKRCGACCRYLVLVMGPYTKELEEQLKQSGLSITYMVRWPDWNDNVVIFIPTRCPYLTDESLCSIYDHRVVTCGEFPEKAPFWERSPECKYYD